MTRPGVAVRVGARPVVPRSPTICSASAGHTGSLPRSGSAADQRRSSSLASSARRVRSAESALSTTSMSASGRSGRRSRSGVNWPLRMRSSTASTPSASNARRPVSIS